MDEDVLILRQDNMLTLLRHREVLLLPFKEFHNVQGLQSVQLLKGRVVCVAHDLFKLADGLLERNHSISVGHNYYLIEYWVALDVHVLQVRVLVHLLRRHLLLLNRKQFLLELVDLLVLMPQLLVLRIVQKPCQHDQCLEDLFLHRQLVYHEENVLLDCFKVGGLNELFLLQVFEIVKLVDHPSHHEDESLDFADDLVREVDVFDLRRLFVGAAEDFRGGYDLLLEFDL